MYLILLPEWNETFLNKNIGALLRYYISLNKRVLVLLRNENSIDEILVDGIKIPFYCYRNSLIRLLFFLIVKRKGISSVYWSYMGYRENLLFYTLRIPYIVKSDSFKDFNVSISRQVKTYFDKRASAIITETKSNYLTLKYQGFSNLQLLPNSFEMKNRLYSAVYDSNSLISLGRFHRDKSHHDILDILECLPRYTWTFIGEISDHDYYSDFLDKAKAKGLSDRITIRPSISNRQELISVIQNFGWLINVSKVEGLPNRFIDAFAAGLPIASIDVGLCSELIVDGVNGLLCESLGVLTNKLSFLDFDIEKLRKNSYDSFDTYNVDMQDRINQIYEDCNIE